MITFIRANFNYFNILFISFVFFYKLDIIFKKRNFRLNQYHLHQCLFIKITIFITITNYNLYKLIFSSHINSILDAYLNINTFYEVLTVHC